MNRDVFRKELIEKDGELLAFQYDRFMALQDKNWNALKWFVEVCDRNDIPYQLACGSLLGAVRDDGMIPWDYDIDTFIPWAYREKLICVLNKSIAESDCYFVCMENSKYPDTILRVVPNGYNEALMHVDVFFLIGTPDDEKERESFRNHIQSLYYKRFYNMFNPYKESYGCICPTFQRRRWHSNLR